MNCFTMMICGSPLEICESSHSLPRYAEISTWFLLCSVSPGPVTLAGLMDPETYTVSSEVAKLNREQELAKYDLFPMYPTGQ